MGTESPFVIKISYLPLFRKSEARKENKQDGESAVGNSSIPIIFEFAVWLNPGPDPQALELLSPL